MNRVSTNEDASHHVNYLNRSCAVNDDVAIADEGKRLVRPFDKLRDLGTEYQLEAAFVVGGFGEEGIGGF